MLRSQISFLAKATKNRLFGPLLAICIAVGLMAGSAIWKSPPPRDTRAKEKAYGPVRENREAFQRPIRAEKARVPLGSIRELHLADVMLTHGNVAQALDRYVEMEPPLGRSDLHDQLLYRVCVSHETLGRNDVALELYGKLAGQGSDPSIQILAKLGKARIWLKTGREQLARVALADAVLQDIDSLPARSSIGGEIDHLMGLACFARSEALNKNVLMDEKAASLAPSWTATDLLAFAKVTAPDAESVNAPSAAKLTAPGVLLIYKYGNDPTEIQLAANLEKSPVTFLVEQLTTAAQLDMEWSDVATRLIKGRAMAFTSSSANLAVSLDTLLAKYDLAWTVSGQKLNILGRSEFSGDALHEIEKATASRVLQHAIAVHPEHALAFYSHFALANLQFEKRDFASAASIYRHCIERFSRSSNTSAAEFNLAKALMNDGNRADALDMFFHVGDSAHGHPLQSATNAYAGRLLLEEGEIQSAIRPLMRAISTAVKPGDRSRSALLLASAYLLADNPHASAQVLMEGKRELLKNETMSSLAAFLNAYAEFQVANDSLAVSQAGRNLINSLSNLNESLELDDFWYLLMGYAMRDIGLPNQMVTTYMSRMEGEQPPWIHEQMQNELVKYWRENNDFGALRSFLAETDNPRQIVELAAVDYHEGQFDKCIAICRNRLLDNAESKNLDDNEKLAFLELLGRAYESKGVHYKAALCFAGMLPLDPADQPQGAIAR